MKSNNILHITERLHHFACDKVTYHRYGEIYDLILGYLALVNGGPITMLEIGVDSGLSARAFATSNHVDLYIGIESDDRKFNDCSQILDDFPNIKLYHMNGYIEDTVAIICEEHPEINLCVDDGSHEFEDIDFFFTHYFNCLAPGGILVAEDIKTLYFLSAHSFAHIKHRWKTEYNILLLPLLFNSQEPNDENIALRFKP
ncbi:MAG: hypothetical protein OXN27_04450 [Candidatus Poribacteria bacterium]|nr:hypothetical protein [Candidatus Poribacteria bacterium]